MISEEDVKRVSKLARIELTGEEIKQFQKQLSDVLGYIEKLNEVNTDNVKPTCHVAGLENKTREDELEIFENTRGILDISPDSEEDHFKVKKVL